MKYYLESPALRLSSTRYLQWLILLAPLLYFVTGCNIDMYSPSLPSITAYFHTTIVMSKNTITAATLGWTIGTLVFGILSDSIGRRPILLFGLTSYVIASVLTLLCHNMHQLMILRFIQGFAVAVSMVFRVLIVDNLSGRRYIIAMLYVSVGYGLGPIVGPFFGGILQHHFGWRANFMALTIVGCILLLLVFLLIKESVPQKHSLQWRALLANAVRILSHRQFMCGAIILGLLQAQIMVYATIGPFVVQSVLHYSALFYGATALLVGVGYFAGNLLNRLLFHYFTQRQLCYIGCALMLCALIIAGMNAWFSLLGIITVMLPVLLMCAGAGFMFANITATNLKFFSACAGFAMAIQGSVLLLCTTLLLFLMSHIHVYHLSGLALILSLLILPTILLYVVNYAESLKLSVAR